MPKEKRTVDAFNLSEQDVIKLMKKTSSTGADADSFTPLTIEDLEATELAQNALSRIFAAADLVADVANEITETLIESADAMLDYANRQHELSKTAGISAEAAQNHFASADAILAYVKYIMQIIEISEKTANEAIGIMDMCVDIMEEDERHEAVLENAA